MNALLKPAPVSGQDEKYDGLLADVLMLHGGIKKVHMGKWAYMNGGRPYLENFFKSPDYDGTRERDFIPALGREFARHLPEQMSVVELGVGVAIDKTRAFIDAVAEATGGKKRIVEYVALDFVTDYPDAAAKGISETHRITSKGIVNDLYKIQGPLNTLAQPVLCSFNSMLWNSSIDPDTDPEYTYANGLRRIGHLVGPKGNVILTHFPVVDAQSTLEIYNREDCKKAVLEIPKLIQRIIAPVCELKSDGTSANYSDIFDYNATYNPHTEFVCMTLVPKADFTIKIMGETYDVLKSSPLEMVGSAKPSTEKFNRILSTARGSLVDTSKSSDGSVVGQLMRFSL